MFIVFYTLIEHSKCIKNNNFVSFEIYIYIILDVGIFYFLYNLFILTFSIFLFFID